jgi:hypothetical protein
MDSQQVIINDMNDDGEMFGITELKVEDEIPTESFLPFQETGCSIEDQRIIFHQQHPTNSQWQDVAAPDKSSMMAIIDDAHQILWNQAICEVIL